MPLLKYKGENKHTELLLTTHVWLTSLHSDTLNFRMGGGTEDDEKGKERRTAVLANGTPECSLPSRLL